MLLELDELELELLDELELDSEDGLELEELELDAELVAEELLLDSSAIARIDRRSPVRGPGNWRNPVWKFSRSGSETSPPVVVSTSFA